MVQIFHGNMVYSKSETELVTRYGSYLIVKDGVIDSLLPVLPEAYAGIPVTELGEDVLIPAFSDLHVHAPQYPQRGLEMDKLLSDWLESYTFPLEAHYQDPEYAKCVYDAFTEDLLRHGTMHAAVFGTIHREATGYLLSRMERLGMESFVGKVNMDTDSPAILCETTEESLRETEAYLEAYSANRHARPILTPRFAPTCSLELLTGLGRLAGKYGVGVQTHLVESIWEAQEAKRRFPDCGCDTAIYEQTGLLGHGPVIGAHFIFPSPEDIRILKKYDGYAVQCPDATVNIIAGIMRTASLMKQGIRVGLGSDVAGGHCLGVYSQVGRAVQLSKLKAFYEPEDNEAITFEQAFFMGTRQSGSVFGKVGSLESGYAFDALVIGGLTDPFSSLTPAQIVERFCYLGETGNIRRRFLKGREVV